MGLCNYRCFCSRSTGLRQGSRKDCVYVKGAISLETLLVRPSYSFSLQQPLVQRSNVRKMCLLAFVFVGDLVTGFQDLLSVGFQEKFEKPEF